jgi:dimethylamine/trimethylamine dehydrogenase
VYTGRHQVHDAESLVLVTSREPDDTLYRDLLATDTEAADAEQQPSRYLRIGDCLQPAIIAAAVYSGHKVARELGGLLHALPQARDRVEIGPQRY